MKHLLNLIRYKNLLIIAFTMFAVRFFFFAIGGKIIRGSAFESINFMILVVSTLLIAAAGNVINDYFDVKADKINKPNQLIVSKYIPKRKAIAIHWYLNSLAFILAIYLSIYYQTFWYVFIDLISINALWLYSSYFKRKLIVGNLIVALLTSMVILLTGVHFFHLSNLRFQSIIQPRILFSNSISESIFHWKKLFLYNGNFIYLLCFFAFSLNLGREIIKDIEDIEGDKLLNSRTLPIKYGIPTAKKTSIGILLLVPVTYFFLFFNYHKEINLFEIIATLPVFLAVVFTVISMAILSFKSTKEAIKFADQLLKLAMLMGISTPFYWWLF